MTTSLRLLLEDFLGLMREEGELDVFLPLLLAAMGHEVVFRAQKGPRQYGVDISTVGRDVDGQKKLFMWLVKCGDIGRTEWDSGPQTVRQSINDVGDTYIATHVAPHLAKLPKKLVVLTNGDFLSNVNLTMTSFLKKWSKDYDVEVETVNGSALAAMTEGSLLDEYVLPPADRALLRRMLANVGTPELCISVGRQLIINMLASCKAPAKTAGARRKKLLTGLRGIRTALSVLHVWAQNEGNLLAPYRLAEFAVLSVWGQLHEEMLGGQREVAHEYAELLFLMTAIGQAYHLRLEPFLGTQDAFTSMLPDSLLVTDAVFKELGRLGLQGFIWAHYAVQGGGDVAHEMAHTYVNRLLALLQSHSCTQSPAYDHHTVDVHVALLCLATAGRLDEAKKWVEALAVRLAYAVTHRKHWPLSASFEDALAVRHGDDEPNEEFMSVTTLVPVLLLWSATLEVRHVYDFLRESVASKLGSTTMNFWSPDEGFDGVVADAGQLSKHGVGEGLLHVHPEPADFLTAMSTPLAEVQTIDKATWYRQGVGYLPLLSAVHWRLQVPREVLAKQTLAIVQSAPRPTAGDPNPHQGSAPK